jgi:hypothetical protein
MDGDYSCKYQMVGKLNTYVMYFEPLLGHGSDVPNGASNTFTEIS